MTTDENRFNFPIVSKNVRYPGPRASISRSVLLLHVKISYNVNELESYFQVVIKIRHRGGTRIGHGVYIIMHADVVINFWSLPQWRLVR